MIRNEVEFKVGQEVTFKPYERAIPAKVIAVDVIAPGMLINGRDERVFYELTGAGRIPLKSVCTGRCIMESQYYESDACNTSKGRLQ